MTLKKQKNKKKNTDLGSDVLQALMHVSENVFGLARDAVVLHLSKLPVVVLKLPLQLLDSLSRLLVLLLEHLFDACTLLFVSIIGEFQVFGHIVVTCSLFYLDLFCELEDLLLQLGNGLLGTLGVWGTVNHVISICAVWEGIG